MAIEVKNYDLSNSHNVSNLVSKVREQMSNRIANMSADVIQKVVLDTRCRNYEDGVVESVIEKLKQALLDDGMDVIVEAF
jgi:uncharacterized protein YmfQ (DUF2313 family)